MSVIRRALRIIDSISNRAGKLASWCCFALVLVGAYDVLMRYVFNAPTVWSYELSCMLGGTISVIGFSYVHRHHGHIRVDVLYSRFRPRVKAIIDVLFGIFFTMPFIAALAYMAFLWMWRAWTINEKMIETYWYPPAAPFRTIVLIGLLIFGLQAAGQLIRDIYLLKKGSPL